MKAPPPTTIREIPRGHSLKPFVDLEWTINRSDPNWVSPLRLTVEAALNPDKHPFHDHAEVAYFIAERRGETVGRIAAIENRLHNEYHSDRVGFFGLFECEDNQATAQMLFDTAASWLKSRGLESIRGPLNFSTNEEISSPGILVDGFETPPMIMMGHNPPYYPRLLEGAGLAKVKDVLALLMDRPEIVPERGVRIMDRLFARTGVSIRHLDLANFRRDVDAIKQVYNAAWSRNWGFVPMTDAEFDHLAKEFRPIVNPKLCLIAESRSEPVGFLLALPNLNEALRFLPSGRLFPFGWLKFLWHRRRIESLRLMTVGFKPNLHRAGLGPLTYRHVWINGVQDGYRRGEASWILEDNLEMIRGVERMGGRTYKRYRIYERGL